MLLRKIVAPKIEAHESREAHPCYHCEGVLEVVEVVVGEVEVDKRRQRMKCACAVVSVTSATSLEPI